MSDALEAVKSFTIKNHASMAPMVFGELKRTLGEGIDA